jgi:hypothetical protein
MKLPDKFQMRVSRIPGFTHTVTKNTHGDYEVNWARGYPNKIGSLPRKTFDEGYVDQTVESGEWIVVEDTPKQDDMKLPDEFYYRHRYGHVSGFAKRVANGFDIIWADCDGCIFFAESLVNYFVDNGLWKILDKRPLTAEQQRTLKNFQEQVAQLDSSIKLNEQTIEHHTRLIANYKSRQDDLRDKIAEIMGEELPSVTKAKALKAELGKLKGNV